MVQWLNGISMIICSQGSISRLFQRFYDVFAQFPQFKKKRVTDQHMDGPMDRQTDPHLKMRGRIYREGKGGKKWSTIHP